VDGSLLMCPTKLVLPKYFAHAQFDRKPKREFVLAKSQSQSLDA